jgi:hypothetical protein
MLSLIFCATLISTWFGWGVLITVVLSLLAQKPSIIAMSVALQSDLSQSSVHGEPPAFKQSFTQAGGPSESQILLMKSISAALQSFFSQVASQGFSQPATQSGGVGWLWRRFREGAPRESAAASAMTLKNCMKTTIT